MFKRHNKISEMVDEHTHVQKDKLVLNPPFPDTIKIEIMAKCNYKCPYCAVRYNLREKGEIDSSFLFRILREAKNIGVKEIGMFLLGESFLCKRLSEYIYYAKKVVGIEYVFITTNGYLCDKKRMVPVLEAGLDSIKFSINAPDCFGYKKMHGVDGMNRVLSNIKWLKKYIDKNEINIKTCVSSIYDDNKKEEFSKFKEYILQYVDDFYFLPLYNQAGHCISGGKIVGNPGRFDNMVSPVPCWALFNAAKITWDGWLTACCFDHDERFKISDLNKVSLLDAWNDKKFINLRKEHLCNNITNKSLCSKCLGLCGE